MAEKAVRKKVVKTTKHKTATRKAPSRASSPVSSGRKTSMVPFVVGGIFVLILCISVGVGLLDSGQINVQGTIDDRKVNGTEEEKEKIESIPVQNKNSVRNNGLVPSSGEAREKALEELENTNKTIASSSATSTDETASSTEEVIEDEESEEATTEDTATDDIASTEEPAEEGVDGEEVAQ